MLNVKFFSKFSANFIFTMVFFQMAWAIQPQVNALPGKTLHVQYSPDFSERDRIVILANEAMNLPLVSITKSVSPYSEGGIHDFYSNGDYWWPNPSTVNGLPFIQKDGQSNPSNFNAHRVAIRQLVDAVASLAMALKMTGQDRYAKKAQFLLNAFFLDLNTRMNPSLTYAQAIPGVTPGRGVGIIDTLHLIDVPLAVIELEKNPSFLSSTANWLRVWFKSYLSWMLSSKNGHDESIAKNNHSVAFWLQVAVFADFVGDQHAMAMAREKFKSAFVGEQMALDGSFPLEMARTKPYGYSIFQLDNMAALCQILSSPSESLWNYQSPDGKGMRVAIDFMARYVRDKKSWPKSPDVEAFEGWPVRQPFLLFAGLAYQDQSLLDLWRQQALNIDNEEVRRNVAITQPGLWLK